MTGFDKAYVSQLPRGGCNGGAQALNARRSSVLILVGVVFSFEGVTVTVTDRRTAQQCWPPLGAETRPTSPAP
jgi:hypothetical protein